MAKKVERSLEERGAEPGALLEARPVSASGAEKLLDAVERLNDEEVANLLADGVEPNSLTGSQASPFLAACRIGSLAILTRFTRAGARVTTQAIEIAALLGHRDVFDHLLTQPIVSQGSKAKDRDALSVSRERALKRGWRDFDSLLRPHREALGLVKSKPV